MARRSHDDPARLERRRAIAPVPAFPAELPITAHREQLVRAITGHQVVVVAGETGSGKSTQLPKLCLQAGRGIAGLIGHTQPRRIAARTVAERIADELGGKVGDAVGYAVRFDDQVGEDTFVKVMTDGILLAELRRDRNLRRYDTIIVDEAHERSLNIDFLLGYLRQLLPRRPDLKVVVTSATIDTGRFADHFGGAPVVEVSGRGHPVEVRYRPLAVDTGEEIVERDQIQGIVDALEELGRRSGDALVFLSGEREIRDTADALRRLDWPDTEVLPLFARLSAADQHRVFRPSGDGRRRIVLATNVAETSITVPGIRAVVDTGNARISRYNRRTKVQRLPIEPISKASADQRAGRCGRVAPGVCIRLYSEEDYEARPDFTEPEILRTNIASVILQMAAIGLGDIEAFPFVEPPDRRSVKDGVALLEELGAFHPDADDPNRRLTPLGRRLAQLPLDPRIGRMVLEAERLGCTREVMVLAAALSIQDPRERPEGHEAQAAQLHARFKDADSDFVSLLNLWTYLDDQHRRLGASAFRRMCRDEHLHYLRVREWRDLFAQVRQVAHAMGIEVNRQPAERDAVHRALLAGLLSQVGVYDPVRQDHQGARNARFTVAPGSALARRKASWVMAAELVETNRLWARTVARIRPEWLEQAGAHLLKRSHGDPWWDAERGSAVVKERATLYGLTVYSGRTVAYGRLRPDEARDMFVEHALVRGEWDGHHAFVEENRRRAGEVRALEDRARRRDLLAPDHVLFDWFDQRVGSDVVSAGHFNRWWKQARRHDPDLLVVPLDVLVDQSAGPVRLEDYPDEWCHGGLSLPLRYRFAPGEDDDGVTVVVPVAELNGVGTAGFDWHVPGHRRELVTALMRGLPKDLRRALGPVPEHVEGFLALDLGPGAGEPLATALARHLRSTTGEVVPPGAWDVDGLPAHLRLTFEVVGAGGEVLGRSQDLDELRHRLRAQVRDALAALAPSVERDGLTAWTFGDLPRTVEGDGGRARGFPALVDEGESVAVRVLDSEVAQRVSMWAGTRRLLLLGSPSIAKAVERTLGREQRLALARNPYGSYAALVADATACAVDSLLAAAGGPVWEAEAFAALADSVRAGLLDATAEVVGLAADILSTAQAVEDRLAGIHAAALAPSVDDVRRQLARLLPPRFLSLAGRGRLPHLLRYVRAAAKRVDKLAADPRRDRERMARLAPLQEAYDRLVARSVPGSAVSVRELRWMLEELRVSLFAQELGTAGRVSESRIRAELERWS